MCAGRDCAMGKVPEASEVRWMLIVEAPLPEKRAVGVVARAKISAVWAGEEGGRMLATRSRGAHLGSLVAGLRELTVVHRMGGEVLF